MNNVYVDVTVKQSPVWAQEYLGRLKNAANYDGDVVIVTCEPAVLKQKIGVTENPDAYTRLSADGGPDYIVLPDGAEDSFKMRSVICHEFYHVLHGAIDKMVHELLDDEEFDLYMERIESSMRSFMAVLMIAAESNIRVEWDA